MISGFWRPDPWAPYDSNQSVNRWNHLVRQSPKVADSICLSIMGSTNYLSTQETDLVCLPFMDSGGRLLSEYDQTGTCVKDYLYLGSTNHPTTKWEDLICLSTRGNTNYPSGGTPADQVCLSLVGGKMIGEYLPPPINTYYYYASDQINSTRLVTDASGVVVHSAQYDPYGGLYKTWVDTYHPKPGFSGKERESGSELDYFGARYYGHKQYRFLSPDPIINRARLIPKRDENSILGFTQEPPFENSDTLKINEKYQEDAISNPQLWNLYAFNRKNPTTYFDPDGRSSLIFDYKVSER